MSDHSFIPKANPKIVPPAIPAPRKESLEQENTRLKAEVERLRASSFVTAVPVEQYERVVKAGDELLDGWIGMYGDHKGSMAQDYIKLWNAAKEGKPSV